MGFALGLYVDDARLWPAFLLNALFFLTLALGALTFISINRVANAGWDTVIRRIPEAMVGYLPLGSIALLLVFFGREKLYEGLRTTFAYGNRVMVFKNTWLSTPFFFGRMAVFLGFWVLLAWLMRRESRRQDLDRSLDHTRKIKRYAAVFLPVFGLTFTLASFDWVMSIEPLFYSTIFAFYMISGVLLSSFAAITVLVILLQRRGLLAEVHETHLHNLGKLVFGFSTFWAYIWLCQYLLVYYANLPEETIYYIRRLHEPGWKTLFIANIFLNWLIPFVMLMSRRAKQNAQWLFAACIVVLVGHWVDLYLMIFPGLELPPLPGLVDIALLLGFVAFFLHKFASALTTSGIIPRNDPYLIESLWHEPGI